MSKFAFIQGLLEQAEDLAILEAINTSSLTRSTFFRNIQTHTPDLAEALEGFWGHIDFIEFAQLTLNSVKLKKGKWKNLSAVDQANLSKLIVLHDKIFPAIAKKIEKLPSNYSKPSVVSAAASGRAAELDWLANLATEGIRIKSYKMILELSDKDIQDMING